MATVSPQCDGGPRLPVERKRQHDAHLIARDLAVLYFDTLFLHPGAVDVANRFRRARNSPCNASSKLLLERPLISITLAAEFPLSESGKTTS